MQYDDEKDWTPTNRTVIYTDAPHNCVSYIIKQVTSSLKDGYPRGTDEAENSCDEAVYHYSWDYKNKGNFDESPKGWTPTKRIVIETNAPRKHMSYILKLVKISLNRDYPRGTSSVESSCDEAVYNFNWDCKVV